MFQYILQKCSFYPFELQINKGFYFFLSPSETLGQRWGQCELFYLRLSPMPPGSIPSLFFRWHILYSHCPHSVASFIHLRSTCTHVVLRVVSAGGQHVLTLYYMLSLRGWGYVASCFRKGTSYCQSITFLRRKDIFQCWDLSEQSACTFNSI